MAGAVTLQHASSDDSADSRFVAGRTTITAYLRLILDRHGYNLSLLLDAVLV